MDWFSLFIGFIVAFAFAFVILLLLPVQGRKKADAAMVRFHNALFSYWEANLRHQKRQSDALFEIVSSLEAIIIQEDTDPDFHALKKKEAKQC